MEEEGQANRLAAAQQKQKKKHTTSWDKLTENGKGKEREGMGGMTEYAKGRKNLLYIRNF